jgi:hypothetical protein
MTLNTSASGGYLAPVDLSTPVEDAAFEDQLQAMVVGITGLPGDMVVPRYVQGKPPKQPQLTENWAAVGIISRRALGYPAVIHHPGDLDLGNGQTSHGYDEMQQHEEVQVLASFYGPVAAASALRFRDGLAIAQNREALFLNGIAFVDAGNVIAAPEPMANDQWRMRQDVMVTLRRAISRTYPVENLEAAVGEIKIDSGLTDPLNTDNHSLGAHPCPLQGLPSRTSSMSPSA